MKQNEILSPSTVILSYLNTKITKWFDYYDQKNRIISIKYFDKLTNKEVVFKKRDGDDDNDEEIEDDEVGENGEPRTKRRKKDRGKKIERTKTSHNRDHDENTGHFLIKNK